MFNFKTIRNISFNGIFWGWNLIFIIAVYLGILPYVGIPLIIATFDGQIALDFFITFCALIAIPAGFCYLGFKYFRRQPNQLISLFYGVEAPLVTWCFVRLFLVRELTLASGLLLGTVLFSVFAYSLNLFKQQTNFKFNPHLEIIINTLILVTGIYVSAVILFYAIPIAVNLSIWFGDLVINFFSFQWIEGFIELMTRDAYFIYTLFIISFAVILVIFSSTLLVLMPLAVSFLYTQLGIKTWRDFADRYNKQTSTIVTVGVIGIWLTLLFSFNQQPQIKAFATLEQNQDNPQAILASESQLRKGLVNAHLSPYRYISPVSRSNSIYHMYLDLGLGELLSRSTQNSYNALISPFLYQGSNDDVKKSAEIYAQLFDTPLQKAERKSVRHAIKSTSTIDQAKAGLLNIDQKKVWLEKQEVTVTPQDDWANVEIHEVYNNQTPDVEEIFYYFSLPESAAITGVWLGESDKLEERFKYQVSPRGAAQEVYNDQVQRTRPIDPALLEQVGVGQYRLRAFPVPPRISSDDISSFQGQQKMHLWLTYQVMKDDRGWALPKLAEKRNIFWTHKTKRIRNGKRQWWFGNNWFEDHLSANSVNVANFQSHQIQLNNAYQVNVKPLTSPDYVLPSQQKYAVIIDTSYSMKEHKGDISQTLNWWSNNLSRNDLDLYVTNAKSKKAQSYSGIGNWNANQELFFGTLQTEDMLNQFQKLKGDRSYDAVLLITDEGSYELSKDKQEIPTIDSPLWMIHLGGEYPRAYNDVVLQAIQKSRGGVADNLPTVMRRLATEKADDLSIIDGYSWQVTESANNATESNNSQKNSIEAISARQLVYYLSGRSNQDQELSLQELDNIHNVAKTYDVVTPYSSMIVLVNDDQREQLRKAEEAEDRFDREVENGFEDLDTPFNPLESSSSNQNVSGVPEPDVWMLFIIMILGLSFVAYRQRQSVQ